MFFSNDIQLLNIVNIIITSYYELGCIVFGYLYCLMCDGPPITKFDHFDISGKSNNKSARLKNKEYLHTVKINVMPIHSDWWKVINQVKILAQRVAYNYDAKNS